MQLSKCCNKMSSWILLISHLSILCMIKNSTFFFSITRHYVFKFSTTLLGCSKALSCNLNTFQQHLKAALKLEYISCSITLLHTQQQKCHLLQLCSPKCYQINEAICGIYSRLPKRTFILQTKSVCYGLAHGRHNKTKFSFRNRCIDPLCHSRSKKDISNAGEVL